MDNYHHTDKSYLQIRNRYTLLLSLILFLWMEAINISYAEIKKGLEVGIYGGTLSVSGGTVQSIDISREVRSEMEKGSSSGGLRIAYNFNQYFGMETAFSVGSNGYTLQEKYGDDAIGISEATKLKKGQKTPQGEIKKAKSIRKLWRGENEHCREIL